jgi:hypothetical protein
VSESLEFERRQLHALTWWTLRDGDLVGVVGLIDREHGYWKAYIGRLSYASVESLDTARIAQIGVHVGETVARALMPPELVDGLEFHAT